MKFEYERDGLRYFATAMGDQELLDYEKGFNKTLHFKFYIRGRIMVDGEWKEVETEAGSFSLSPMPGCCGVVVSHGTFLKPEFRHCIHSDNFRHLKEALCRKAGYSCVIATTVMAQPASVFNMYKSKYKIDTVFRNKRTKNDVGIGVKKL